MPNSAVKENVWSRTSFFLEFVHLFNDFLEHLNCCWCGVKLPCPMIAYVNSISSVYHGESRVFTAHYTFRVNWHSRLVFDVLNDFPAEMVILASLDKLSEA